MNGVKLYYYVIEATSPQSSIRETNSLETGMQGINKGAKDFSAMVKRGGADFVTFTSASGEPCAGMRKYGPSSKTGFKWIMNATRCAPKGKPASDAETDKFIADAGYRS